MIYPTIIQAPNTNESTLPATSQLLKQAYTTKNQNTAFIAFAFYATVVSPAFISLDSYYYTSSQIIDSDLHIDLWTCDPDPDPNTKHSSLPFYMIYPTIIQAPNTNESTLPATSQLLMQAYTTKKQNTAFMAFAFYATVVSPAVISLDSYYYTSSQIIDRHLLALQPILVLHDQVLHA
jgi:hypothetical protein